MVKFLVLLSILNGPFSVNKAKVDEHPGPPVNHIVKGSDNGCDLESNNQ